MGGVANQITGTTTADIDSRAGSALHIAGRTAIGSIHVVWAITENAVGFAGISCFGLAIGTVRDQLATENTSLGHLREEEPIPCITGAVPRVVRVGG